MHTCREPRERQCDIRDRVVIGGDICLKNTISGDICLKNTIDGQGQTVITHNVGTYDHNALTNRDLDDQHPISAITGLAGALSAKPDSSELATIAFTGSLNDVDPDIVSILDCGTSTEVI